MNHAGVGDEIVADVPNPAVSSSLLQEILQWKVNGVTERDFLSSSLPYCTTRICIHYLETWYVHCI